MCHQLIVKTSRRGTQLLDHVHFLARPANTTTPPRLSDGVCRLSIDRVTRPPKPHSQPPSRPASECEREKVGTVGSNRVKATNATSTLSSLALVGWELLFVDTGKATRYLTSPEMLETGMPFGYLETHTGQTGTAPAVLVSALRAWSIEGAIS